VIILIPAFEPDAKLVRLVAALDEAPGNHRVLVVNDGSDPRFDHLFEEAQMLGATAIGHRPNRGKGFALKVGLAYVTSHFPGQSVVCADSDGQHSVSDILAVGAVCQSDPNCIVLGSRAFTGEIPLRSRFGNAATRTALRAASGLRLQDTQTGLRGYPPSLMGWLGAVDGEKFEYEINVLLEAQRHGIAVREVPVKTIYIGDNASSHFRPLVDSIRVYLPLIKFSMSSLLSFSLDFVLVLVLMALTGNLLLSVVVVRICSATLNFTVNRRLVFDPAGRRPLPSAIGRYATLAAGILIANYGILFVLHTSVSVALPTAKFAAEAFLLAASFFVQKHLVFVWPGKGRGGDESRAEHSDALVATRSRNIREVA
jgi:glycosyltransferase involved in cell wall biosynthesis